MIQPAHQQTARCARGWQNRHGNIETEFDRLDESLGIMDDLIAQFAPASQKFVDDYNNARTIVDTAASHASPNQPTPAPQAKPKP